MLDPSHLIGEGMGLDGAAGVEEGEDGATKQRVEEFHSSSRAAVGPSVVGTLARVVLFGSKDQAQDRSAGGRCALVGRKVL